MITWDSYHFMIDIIFHTGCIIGDTHIWFTVDSIELNAQGELEWSVKLVYVSVDL